MATSYHMEALRRQRIIERAAAARLRIESAIHEGSGVVTPAISLANGVEEANEPTKLSQQSNRTATASVHSQSKQSNRSLSSEKLK